MGGIYKGSTKVNKLYFGSKAIQKVYKGSTLIWSARENSAGNATITYSNATGIASIVGIVSGPTIYARTSSSFSNLSTTDTATFSVNTGEELRIEPVISSGNISYKIEASNGLNAITKLSIKGRRLATSAFIYLYLPAMPNLKSVEFADEWNGGILLVRGAANNENTFFNILSLCPKSHLQNQQLLILYN